MCVCVCVCGVCVCVCETQDTKPNQTKPNLTSKLFDDNQQKKDSYLSTIYIFIYAEMSSL